MFWDLDIIFMLENNRQEGYIALFSTIILSAVFLLLFTGMFTLAIGGMNRVTEKENFFGAVSWANICIEDALNKIRNDPDYAIGDISYSESDEGCDIGDVVKHSDELISFSSEANFYNHEKKIEVTVEIVEEKGVRTINVVEWSE